MIRKSQSEDMASILALWMKSTIYAHPFIEERYWHESEAIVRDVYYPPHKPGYGRKMDN